MVCRTANVRCQQTKVQPRQLSPATKTTTITTDMLCVGSVFNEPSWFEKLNSKEQTRGARDVKYHQAKELKTQPANTQQKTSPRNSARMLLNTANYDAVSEQEDGDERLPPQETNDDQTPCYKNMVRTECRPNSKRCKTTTKTKLCQTRTKSKTESHLTIKNK